MSSADSVQTAADAILRRFGPRVRALMAYGSRVFGEARMGSAYDFWILVDDIEAFHRDNADFYRTGMNIASTPEEQIALNREGPNFYALIEDGMEIKIAVLGLREFAALCRDAWWTVKGRFQKPMRVIRSDPAAEEAIAAARREGFLCALNLVPKEFTLDRFLCELCGLSYRAEIRPENKSAKVRSILRDAFEPLKAIYLPLLEAHPTVERRGEVFVDRRPEAERAAARRATLRALRRSKWSGRSLRYLWRNFRSHRAPIRYILRKALGEVEKALRRRADDAGAKAAQR